MDAYAPEIERVMKQLYDSLREKDRRRYAAAETPKLGLGGIEYVARLLGCDPKTIRQGQSELEGTDDLDSGRVRKKGRAETIDPDRLDTQRELLGSASGPHRGSKRKDRQCKLLLLSIAHCPSANCACPSAFFLGYNVTFANPSNCVSAFLRHGTSHELFIASSWANRMLARAGACAFAPGACGVRWLRIFSAV
jgi:hypothetical protein